MLRISVVDGARKRRIVVEGALVAPWADELVLPACQKARADLQGREFIVDLRGVTAISREGESVLIQLIRNKIHVQCGIFARELLRQLASELHLSPTSAEDGGSDPDVNA